MLYFCLRVEERVCLNNAQIFFGIVFGLHYLCTR